MIKFYVMTSAYNRYGGHQTFTPIGDYLTQDSPDFGGAVKEITVTLSFASAKLTNKDIKSLYEDHHKRRAALPKAVYRRASGKISIEVPCDIVDGDNLGDSPRLSLPLFKAGVDEVIDALGWMKKRIKKTDDFDVDGFLAHCDVARARIPDSEDALQLLAAELDAKHQAQQAALSPWDKLGIDWEDFHSQAREILDDPFFWNGADDFSPNGNDTGSDILAEYRKWNQRHQDGQTIQFVERLAKQWGYANFAGVDTDMRDEAAIGLAFADLKLRAVCDPPARALALQAILRQRTLAQDAVEWPHKDEKLKALNLLEAKLHAIGTSTEAAA